MLNTIKCQNKREFERNERTVLKFTEKHDCKNEREFCGYSMDSRKGWYFKYLNDNRKWKDTWECRFVLKRVNKICEKKGIMGTFWASFIPT